MARRRHVSSERDDLAAGESADDRIEFAVPTGPSASRFARRSLQRWMDAQHVDVALTDDAMVVVSELVTNAVLHASSPVRVVAQLDRGWLRLEVHDTSAHPPVPRRPESGRPGGYGLRIVDGLAADWGWSATPAGKCVWTHHRRADERQEPASPSG